MLADASETEPLKLFMVEDDVSYIELFKHILSGVSIPYEIEEVLDGEAATNYLLNQVGKGLVDPPDLIFLDLNLPKKNGIQVLREIKNREMLREIPILILTTSKNKNEIRQCYELHANSFLVKPNDLTDFRKMISYIENFWFKLATLPRPYF
ncbi:MAG: response regulator [Halobacteriovoraceae bacterium]|nr:response regulator [Halobacteriovoraceae bacterium]